ncbi:MAG: ABC transporter permease subunit [Planctomycetota bacterium]|nr:MAG: ABC transporter permease subunit [Planctomycetota bacterium]
MRVVSAIAVVVIAAVGVTPVTAMPVVIGSKKFTESVILAEIAGMLVAQGGSAVELKAELGGTRILFEALRRGEIDIYPEYTGTITQEILADRQLETDAQLRAALAELGIAMTAPLGFNNTYAIGMRPEHADELGIAAISDLVGHPSLRFGFTAEFMERGDGWPALRGRYRLPQQHVRGLDHDLALRALADGGIDATDLYSTDAAIAAYGFRVLDDDRRHFPRYDAVFLYRAELGDRAPAVVEALDSLAGTIDEPRMIQMNSQAVAAGASEAVVAARFIDEQLDMVVAVPVPATLVRRQAGWLGEHLFMVGISLVLAIAVAVPLGVIAARYAKAGHVILGLAGMIQTVPALALLVLLMPLPWPREAGRPDVLGLGTETAIVALFLYSLLPIVRNTHAGLRGISPAIRESAEALGLSVWSKLTRIEMPLASPTILAGIKTAAVMNIGFATLGALIGAGGYGQPILTGIRRYDFGLILEGAVPAAVLALSAQVIFDLAERAVVPRGLRLRRSA